MDDNKLFDDPEAIIDPDLMEEITEDQIADLVGDDSIEHLGLDTSNVDGDYPY